MRRLYLVIVIAILLGTAFALLTLVPAVPGECVPACHFSVPQCEMSNIRLTMSYTYTWFRLGGVSDEVTGYHLAFGSVPVCGEPGSPIA